MGGIQFLCFNLCVWLSGWISWFEYCKFIASSLSLHRAIPPSLLGCSRAFTNLCSAPTSCPTSLADLYHGDTYPTLSAVHCSHWLTWSVSTRCVASYNVGMWKKYWQEEVLTRGCVSHTETAWWLQWSRLITITTTLQMMPWQKERVAEISEQKFA